MGQSATHPCADQETDATLTIHSSSEITLDASLCARMTITHHTDAAFASQEYPNTDMPTRLMPCAKALPVEQAFPSRKWLISLSSQKATPSGSVAWRDSEMVKDGQQRAKERAKAL
jgi:hypothetical protein